MVTISVDLKGISEWELLTSSLTLESEPKQEARLIAWVVVGTVDRGLENVFGCKLRFTFVTSDLDIFSLWFSIISNSVSPSISPAPGTYCGLASRRSPDAF